MTLYGALIKSHRVDGALAREAVDLRQIRVRYVGSVAWRQNDQSFDGAKVTITAVPGVTGLYAYIGKVRNLDARRLNT